MAVSVVQILRAVSGGMSEMRTLHSIELCRTSSGSPIYNVGNSAVLFRAMIDGKKHLLKCYTSKSRYRHLIYGERLRLSELYVPINSDGGEWIDVLVDEWVEGQTLGEYIAWCVARADSSALLSLSAEFDRLALCMINSEWAHGDLTCENIIVDGAAKLHLVDFDAAFVPSLEGEMSCELGTKAYQNPLRDIYHFDRSVDDYSLALISTALSAIAADLTHCDLYNDVDGLLYNPVEIIDGRSEAFECTLKLLSLRGEAAAYVIAQLLTCRAVHLPELGSLLRCKVEGIHSEASPTTIFCRDGKWGYLNEFGREAIPPLFDAALGFSESLAAVKLGDAWHYIDNRARVVINCSGYLALKSFSDGVGRALTTDGWTEIYKPHA